MPEKSTIGESAVTKSNRRIANGAPLAALVSAFFAAGEAQAAGDQLVLLPDPVKLIVLIVFFAALVYPINTLLLKPIFRVLDAREEKTTGTRKRADQLAADAEVMLERYENSISEVRRDAEELRKQTLVNARNDGSAATSGARGDAEGEVTRAREEIAAALEQARETLKAQSAVLAGNVAERALGRPLS
jgi:F-type H+-transporting ATPase subunit b